MTLRCCKFCYKTVTDEKHSWFCPFGSGMSYEISEGQEDNHGGRNAGGGSGGSDPGEPNIPVIPSGGGGTGVGISLAAPERSLSHGAEKPAKIAYHRPSPIADACGQGFRAAVRAALKLPALAPPTLEVENRDGDAIRDYGMGKR